jgi:hypothetical protein
MLERNFIHGQLLTLLLQPIIVPLLVALRNASYLPRLSPSTAEHLQSQWLCTGVGAASALALARSYNLTSLGIGAVVLLGLTGFYSILVRIYEQDATQIGQSLSSGLVFLLKAIASRAAGVLALLVVGMLLIWSPGARPSFWNLVAGSMKAVHWVVMFWIGSI